MVRAKLRIDQGVGAKEYAEMVADFLEQRGSYVRIFVCFWLHRCASSF